MTDAVIAKLNKAAIAAGMTDAARAPWVSANAPLYKLNAEGKARRADKPDLSPKKSLQKLRETTPDAFADSGAPKGKASANVFADESKDGQARRIEFIKSHSASESAREALLANRTISGQPRTR